MLFDSGIDDEIVRYFQMMRKLVNAVTGLFKKTEYPAVSESHAWDQDLVVDSVTTHEEETVDYMIDERDVVQEKPLYQQAREVQEESGFSAALPIYFQAIKAGETQAMVDLGDAYMYGNDKIPVDLEKARKWYKSAVKYGNLNGNYSLAMTYISESGSVDDENKEIVETLLLDAAEKGHLDSITFLGAYYYDMGEPERSVKWFEMAVKQGDSDSSYFLSQMYLNGYGVPQNMILGAQYLISAAEGGMPEAMSELASLYISGTGGVPVDVNKGVYWASLADEMGNANGTYLLSGLYFGGTGVKKDYPKALSLCEKAADLGHEAACVQLGFYYYSGWGCNVDREKGFDILSTHALTNRRILSFIKEIAENDQYLPAIEFLREHNISY